MKKIFIVIIVLILVIILLPLFNKKSISKDVKITNDYDTYYLKDHDNEDLDIFKDKEYIEPGSTGKYHFNILNNSNEKLKYKFTLKENNKYKLDIKYKIKMNDKYLIEEWTKIDKMKINEVVLKDNNYNTYELEWKWFDSDNDNNIEDNSFYKVNIIVESNGIKK